HDAGICVFRDSVLTAEHGAFSFLPNGAVHTREQFACAGVCHRYANVVTTEPRGFQVFNLQSRGSLKAVLLSGAAIAAAYSIVAPAFADEAVETVVVTGSRIQTTNLSSPSPISVSTAEQIQMTKATSLEDVLTKMTGPDLAGGLSVNSNNGGVGLSLI